MGEDEIEHTLLILIKLRIVHWCSLFELYSVPYLCKTGLATYFLFLVQLLQTRFDFWFFYQQQGCCVTDIKAALSLSSVS